MARLEAYRDFAASAAEHGFVLVRVVEAKGSTPRNTDAWMLVSETMAVSAPSAADGWNSKPSTEGARILAGAAAQPISRCHWDLPSGNAAAGM
jgi:xanthine dehydrogenase accessory factor